MCPYKIPYLALKPHPRTNIQLITVISCAAKNLGELLNDDGQLL